MGSVHILSLATGNRNLSSEPISIEEVEGGISSLQCSKSPGLDSLQAEFYKTPCSYLLLLWLCIEAYERGWLPKSMIRAFIMVISKPGKDLYPYYK